MAVAEGLISADEYLLHPRLYMARGLEEWLTWKVKYWIADQSTWVI
jgi:hypothetical protein